MVFYEEPDLADMLSDTGVAVTWTPAVGDPVTRQGLYRRQTETLIPGVAGDETEKVPSVLVELTRFRGVQEGDAITVVTDDGNDWVVRKTWVEMRSLLRIYLATPPAVS